MIEQIMHFKVITKTPRVIEFDLKIYIENHTLHVVINGLDNNNDYNEINFIVDILFDFVDDLKDRIVGRFEEYNDYMIKREMFNLISFIRNDCYYDFYYERLRCFNINFCYEKISIL